VEAVAEGKVDLVAWADGRRLGPFTRVDGDPAVHALVGQRGLLVVAAGGARRKTVRNEDVLSTWDVTFSKSLDTRPDDGRYRADWRAGARWDGPPESWPKASTVLLDFAEPLRSDHPTADELEYTSTLAATVWTAVVMADRVGDTSVLEQIRRTLAVQADLPAIVEMLVERKRVHFAHDPRLMHVTGVVVTRGRADIQVGWRMPPDSASAR
jgi:hypothetical protein